MNKRELAIELADRLGIKPGAADTMINLYTGFIRIKLKRQVVSERLFLSGFGAFMMIRKVEKSGTNPRTHAVIKKKAAKVPKFEPVTAWRRRINGL